MADDIPPAWAGRAFCKRANLNYDTVLCMDGEQGTVLRSAVKAGALLIAAHEQPPVDPFTECIKIILGGFEGERHAQEYADSLREELAKRGLKIVELAGKRTGEPS